MTVACQGGDHCEQDVCDVRKDAQEHGGNAGELAEADPSEEVHRVEGHAQQPREQARERRTKNLIPWP